MMFTYLFVFFAKYAPNNVFLFFFFQYGLYGSIVPGFVYAIFGTIKETTVGPTAINALMSYNYAGSSPIRSLTLSFFVGLIEIAAGVLNLGMCKGQKISNGKTKFFIATNF